MSTQCVSAARQSAKKALLVLSSQNARDRQLRVARECTPVAVAKLPEHCCWLPFLFFLAK
jgi:hypothetical protein